MLTAQVWHVGRAQNSTSVLWLGTLRSTDELDTDFRREVADVLAQTLLIAHRFDIDIAAEIEAKWLVRGSTP